MNSSPSSRTARPPLLSVIMPVYNERGTIGEIIRRVTAVNLEKEIIIVDDFSTDGSREYLKELEQQLAKQKTAADSANRLKFLFQDRNYGKGAALRRGFAEACGAIVVIQDADLELNPQEYVKLIAPIERYEADVVYGSRFLNLGNDGDRGPNYWGNRMLTAASNLFTGLGLTDVWTCYKTFRREVLNELDLKEDRFAFEPEFTAKIARQGWRVSEVAISYASRSVKEGKKINWKDGFRGLSITIYYGAHCLFLPKRAPLFLAKTNSSVGHL